MVKKNSGKNKIDLSVIVLSYNTKEILRQCLGSIFRSGFGGYTGEVVVVDNASIDGSSLMVKNDFPGAKLVVSKKNLGFAGGNNLGLSGAKGRYILFLNSDTEVAEGAFEKVISFMDKNKKAGALTAKTVLFSGGLDPDCHRGFPTPWASICYFLGLEKLFPKSRLFGGYHKFYLDMDKAHPVDAGAGAFMLVRKEVVEKVGGWDEKYFFYGEDLDFFYRIKEAGWEVLFYPEPLVKHYKGASSGLRKEARKMGVAKADRETRIKTAKASVKAMEIFYRKFYQDKYPRWLTLLVVFGIKAKSRLRVLQHQLS